MERKNLDERDVNKVLESNFQKKKDGVSEDVGNEMVFSDRVSNYYLDNP